MVASKRFYYDDASSITNRMRINDCSENPVYTGSTATRCYAYSNCDRHRPRPPILFPTQCEFTEYRSNGNLNFFGCRTGGYTSYYREGHQAFVFNAMPATNHFFDSYGDNGENQAILRAGNSFTGMYGDFGEDLLSLAETGGMIGKRGRQLASMALALKNGNWKKLGDMMKGAVPTSVKRLPKGKRLADGWLEVQFGWMPLVDSIYGAVSAFRNSLSKGQMVKGNRQHTRKGGFNPVGRADSAGDATPGSIRRIAQYGPNASARSYGRVRNPALASLNALGLANPALIAWQRLPFSFVVDWYLPISHLLGYMSNGLGLDNYMMSVVTESGSYSVWADGSFGQSQRFVNRSLRTPTFFPPPVTTTRNLGIWHVATSAALVRQAFGR